MKVFKCKIAQKGFYAGEIHYIKAFESVKEKSTLDSSEERKRIEKVRCELNEELRAKKWSENNEDILDTVLLLLEDEGFFASIYHDIDELGYTAEYAVKITADRICEVLSAAQDEYISQRQEDICGLADKLISGLVGENIEPKVKCLLCAQEMSPAQLASYKEDVIGAILTYKGSPNSHTSIIAANLEVPYFYGTKEAVEAAKEASFVIMNSETGEVILDPPEDEKQRALERMKNIEAEHEYKESHVTVRDRAVKIYANISSLDDLDKLDKAAADGVGLFRTEFLYMNSSRMPDENCQLEIYRKALEIMKDREVIIRTMDIGSDKCPAWIELFSESNPALGWRGIRVLLEYKELLRVQLRALFRAAVYGRLKIMFPMITAAWEIDEIYSFIREVATELDEEGMDYSIPETGIMIETPAAALCAEELAAKVDFFSIGTNDLTQYTLALDREAQGLERYFDPYHEAIFKLIKMTVDGAHKHGKKVGVCGQLAADEKAVERLVAAGVDDISVPLKNISLVRKIVNY